MYLTLEELEEPLHGLLVVLVLLALDNDLLQSVDELVSPLLWEGIVEEVSGLVEGVRHLCSSLFGDTVLELLSLASSLTLGVVAGRGLLVGLGFGGTSLLVGSAQDLVLLGLEGSIGVSRAGEVLGLVAELALGLLLVLVSLSLSLLLLLLSLVVGRAGRSGVALGVDDPDTR